MRTMTLLVLACLTLTMPAYAVNCGDTLSGGSHVLTADLLCGDAPGLTVRDGATLDLGGFLVSAPLIGILMDGQASTLLNGLVESVGPDENGTGIQIEGAGGHRVKGVRANALLFGILILSDGNDLIDNGAAGEWGMIIAGHGNTLRQNDASGSIGILVEGNANRLTMNLVEGFEVITVEGEGNWLVRNRNIDQVGLYVDTHGDCTHNHWLGNRGPAADPACILEGALLPRARK